MKSLFSIFLLSITLASHASLINDNDVFTRTSLAYDVEGIEMWTIPSAGQAEAQAKFENKCLKEIPERLTNRLTELRIDLEDFSLKTSIVKNNIRGLGTQFICRSDVKIVNLDKYSFKFDYSPIFKEDAYETCKREIEILDAQGPEASIFDRRAYFETKTRRGEMTFTKCQVLAIKISTIL